METITPIIKRTTEPAPKIKLDANTILSRALSAPEASMKLLVKAKLFCFVRYFWDTYSQDTFSPNWHIEMVCEELEEAIRRVANGEARAYDLLFNQPPGTTKTAIISIFLPAWCWTNWYWMRFITTSHSASLSLESAEYSRDVILSEKFQHMFPEIDIKQDKATKSNFRIVYKEYKIAGQLPRITNGGGRVSTSVDARIMGFHAHVIIWDDLIDPKRAFSEVELENVNRYVDSLSTRKTSKKVSLTIGMMQRLAQGDPTDHILAKPKKKVRHICLPGEVINYLPQLKPQSLASKYVDGLLDPVRMSWEILEDMEADLGQYGYASQVGQKPTKPGGGMFKVTNFSIVDFLLPQVSIKKVVRYWDKAGTDEKELKKGKDACFTAGTKMALLASGKYLIIDRVKGRWSAEERERVIKQTAQADGTSVDVWIEQEPGSGGKESAEATIRNLAGFVIQAECPSGDKVRRADPYSVQVNSGNVQILRGEWNQDFINEHELFPFSKFKDQVDSAGGAFNKLVAARTVVIF